MSKIAKLLISIGSAEAAGIVGSIFIIGAMDPWYMHLTLPPFSPPRWVFAPVWILLYFLLGLSYYFMWVGSKEDAAKKRARVIYFMQLLLNALWAFLFFGLRSPMLGFLEIMILWVLVLLTIYSFYRINRNHYFLLIPYFLWITFAALLNYSIMVLNP